MILHTINIIVVVVDEVSGVGARIVAVKSTGCGLEVGTRENEIFIYIYVFISSLWCRGEVRR